MKPIHFIYLPLLFIFVLSGSSSARAQADHEVVGTVTDAESGAVLPGVNIVIKGTTQGTSTDSEGRFTINPRSQTDTLVFTFIGYETLNEPLNKRNNINVSLHPQALEGEELVVVGYGEQQRENVTGAISTVSPAEIE